MTRVVVEVLVAGGIIVIVGVVVGIVVLRAVTS